MKIIYKYSAFYHCFQITGIWYVIEILQHKTDEKLYHGEKYEVSTCPFIYLTYFTGSDSELKLYWDEDEGNVEYRFKINDKANPGFWMSTGAQNGKNQNIIFDNLYVLQQELYYNVCKYI